MIERKRGKNKQGLAANGDLATADDGCTASGGSAIFYSFEGLSIIHQEEHQHLSMDPRDRSRGWGWFSGKNEGGEKHGI
ncbi:hypothetical protein GXN76_12130 [Kroppenstedtia pulmonis]|uniref:Uncharacterized protein n=1 Tax=Kroppenstedtia pulmonis TaxID=1380685 RepID=A0A7D3Y2T8_9BACL|nr:hypothetical protein [Kroppenstedtia pulmonis]QKG85143.1 hypothetical protein GXN76_12130 [Kroppenstedtia pulmonis]